MRETNENHLSEEDFNKQVEEKAEAYNKNRKEFNFTDVADKKFVESVVSSEYISGYLKSKRVEGFTA